MNRRTVTAKAAYWLAGQLSRVKTYQRFYEFEGFLENENEDGTYVLPEPRDAGRRWFQCQWSTNLMLWSSHHDPDHWDHWALDHTTCEHENREIVRCESCGGWVCPWDQRDSEESEESEQGETREADARTSLGDSAGDVVTGDTGPGE
jgi:hypothetical protein